MRVNRSEGGLGMGSSAGTNFEKFGIDPSRGFLPKEDPLQALPAEFHAWEEAACQLPKLLVSDQTRAVIDSLPLFDAGKLSGEREYERAMILLSYLGHSYVWASKVAPSAFPKCLAVPWHAVAKKLGRPPVLSYASYALHNWRRFDLERGAELGNIALLQNFLGGIDEEWFVVVHIAIEEQAAGALTLLLTGLDARDQGDTALLNSIMKRISASLARIYETLARMPDACDPYVYYTRVRPYIHGWKDNPALPDGMLYEGVEEYRNVPQKFRGETGAQSSIIPVLDAFFDIAQEDDFLSQHLREMRNYMPPPHRAFIETIEERKGIRDFVKQHLQNAAVLRASYNECVEWIDRFRGKHLQYAADYIEAQKQSSTGNPTIIGTGGTPFITYLTKHQRGTAAHLL